MSQIFEGKAYGGPLHGRMLAKPNPMYTIHERLEEDYHPFHATVALSATAGLRRHVYLHQSVKSADGRLVPFWLHSDLTLENLLAEFLTRENDADSPAKLTTEDANSR